MTKSVSRVRRPPANAEGSPVPRPGAGRQRVGPAQRHTREPHGLLDRILDTPHLAHVIPRLRPEVLHRVIQRCGLADCGELVALATPDQLTGVFDLDLWRGGLPGRDEQFDADRFGAWLEVLMDLGASVAARVLAAMDLDLVIAGLAQHVRVFDPAALPAAGPGDGEESATVGGVNDALDCEVGGYLVVARRGGSWDAVIGVLLALDAEHPDCFHQVMGGCRSLSNSTPEVDGLDDLLTDPEQVLFDLAFDREQRREQQGYVTPAQARAFLEMARQLRLGDSAAPPPNPVARAYFRAIEWTDADANPDASGLPLASAASPDPQDTAAAVAAIVKVLREADVLPPQPRALLEAPRGHAPRLARIQAHLQLVRDHDEAAYVRRSQELAYLANTIAVGCSVQARSFTEQEAADSVVAVCNLGLENWPAHWLADDARHDAARPGTGPALPDDFLVGHDLVGVFQVGWTVLHQEVCLHAAERLIGVVAELRCADHEIQRGLDQLRAAMTRQWQAGAPWRARDALDVIAALDMPAWTALLGLMGECPVVHAALAASHDSSTRRISAAAFEFIADNSQIASVREFMHALPAILRR